jgi:hypothetical protein
MAFSLPFKQLAATAPVLRLLSQRDRNIRADQSARDPPFSGCGWHAYADLWCVASVMIKPRIRKAPWLIHCLIVPKGCSTVSRRRGRISGSPSGGLPSGRARPRFPDARPGDNAIGHGRRLARRIEGQGESGDACGRGEPSSDAHAPPPGTLPNPALTPGAVRTADPADVCGDRSTRQYRHWSRARDDRILAEYGLPPGPHPSYEVDHLIPLDLGGADVDANLWTEPRRSIEPLWNAERKDRLEWHMADMVCGGQLGLATAQKAIRDDWVDASRTYVGGR